MKCDLAFPPHARLLSGLSCSRTRCARATLPRRAHTLAPFGPFALQQLRAPAAFVRAGGVRVADSPLR